MKLPSLLSFAALSCFVVACTWETDLPDDAKSIHVEPHRELVVTDETILSGPLANNRNDGPLSFHRAMGSLRVAPDAPRRWLEGWSRRLEETGHVERAKTFDAKVKCAWLRADPNNQCDDACSSCRGASLDLERAPFRLIAITNRTDLSVMPDRVAEGGEGRFVFGLTDGPGDEPSSPSLPFAIIFEYAQEGSALSWAEKWHALGEASAADFPSRLTELTDAFVAKGAIAQIRTADAWTGPMLLHQFRIDHGEIVASAVRNTPEWSRVTAASLSAYTQDNGTALEDGTAVLPQAWWAPSSSPADERPPYVATLDHHDALVRGTCGGCHAEAASGFHIDPLAKGEKKLSRFLVDPTRDKDELRRRTEWMQLTLAQLTTH